MRIAKERREKIRFEERKKRQEHLEKVYHLSCNRPEPEPITEEGLKVIGCPVSSSDVPAVRPISHSERRILEKQKKDEEERMASAAAMQEKMARISKMTGKKEAQRIRELSAKARKITNASVAQIFFGNPGNSARPST